MKDEIQIATFGVTKANSVLWGDWSGYISINDVTEIVIPWVELPTELVKNDKGWRAASV